MNRLGWLLLALGMFAHAAMAAEVKLALHFSDSAPGTTLPVGWTPLATSHHKRQASVALASDGATTVLHIDADRSAGAIVHVLDMPAATVLQWRWKIDHSIAAADLSRKSGDDFAARVYVFFDVPKSELSLGERLKLKLARSVMGEDLPRAALCYVWDNHHPIGTIAPNAFYGSVRTIVLQSGDAHASQWQTQRRDLAADFRTAFGHAAPKVTGVALGTDTDNTGSRANAWFGDLLFMPAASTATAQEPIR